jgi:hypothetical protein
VFSYIFLNKNKTENPSSQLGCGPFTTTTKTKTKTKPNVDPARLFEFACIKKSKLLCVYNVFTNVKKCVKKD